MKFIIFVLLLPFTTFAMDSYKVWSGKLDSHVNELESLGLKSGELHGKISIERAGNEINFEDCLEHGVTTPHSFCNALSFVSSGNELYIRGEDNNPTLLVGTITNSEISYESLYLGIRGTIKFLENGNLSVFIEDGFGLDFSYIRKSKELIRE